VKNSEVLSRKQSKNQATDQSGTVDFFLTNRSDSLTISDGDTPKVAARLKIVRKEGLFSPPPKLPVRPVVAALCPEDGVVWPMWNTFSIAFPSISVLRRKGQLIVENNVEK
jgi:hypothetical protein